MDLSDSQLPEWRIDAKARIDANRSTGMFVTVRFLGGGGGGQVWLCNCVTGNQAAVKFLNKAGVAPLIRFKYEIATLEANAAVPGILPILEKHLPIAPTEADPACFAMPLAVPLETELANKDAVDICGRILEVGQTLVQLHAANFSHRDIKPQNLVWWQRRAAVIDFGLVSFDGKEEVTEENSPLGPRWTMAPEMRRDPSVAEGKPADVYSLAKTIWIFLTGEKKGFDGQYVAASGIGLNRFSPGLYTVGLDALLAQATEHDPSKRPSMTEFCNRLEKWIRELQDWHLRSTAQWAQLPREIFPRAVPGSAVWVDPLSIVKILDTFASTKGLNHMFLPNGGGLDMAGVSLGSDGATIEIGVEDGDPKLRFVVRPTSLHFEAVSADPQWNYLRLETKGLIPVTTDTEADSTASEEVVEIRPGAFAPRSAWDEGEYRGAKLPASARLLVRFPRGSFVVFQKSGAYNQRVSQYLGEHDKMGADAFRRWVTECASKHALAVSRHAPLPPP